jgi:hypothetical protein
MRTLNFKEFLNESHHNYSADEIIDHIKKNTPFSSDIPDYFIEKIKDSKKTFRRRRVKILEIIAKDKHLRDYVISKEKRYDDEDDMPPREALTIPIVIFKGEVFDGYSRISTLYHEGETEIDAFVAE